MKFQSSASSFLYFHFKANFVPFLCKKRPHYLHHFPIMTSTSANIVFNNGHTQQYQVETGTTRVKSTSCFLMIITRCRRVAQAALSLLLSLFLSWSKAICAYHTHTHIYHRSSCVCPRQNKQLNKINKSKKQKSKKQ